MNRPPLSVSAAVEELLRAVPPSEQAAITAMAEDELDAGCNGLGIAIRDQFALWHGNEDLMADCGALDPDGASAVIIRAFWLALRR